MGLVRLVSQCKVCGYHKPYPLTNHIRIELVNTVLFMNFDAVLPGFSGTSVNPVSGPWIMLYSNVFECNLVLFNV